MKQQNARWPNVRKWALGAVASAIALTAYFLLPGPESGEALAAMQPEPMSSRPPTMVELTPAREMDFAETLVSDGSIAARNYSLVSPRIGGIVDAIAVREGDTVERDKTELFRVDNEKLRQSVEHAEQALIIARSTLDEKKAKLIKATADRQQAEKDFARTRELYNEKVVTLSQFEVDETKVIQMRAEEKVADNAVILAGQNVTLAEITLKMQVKDLRDSIVFAPISGIVSARYAEPGEMGSPGKTVVRIDDTKSLKAVAYLPGHFYPRIHTESSMAEVRVLDRLIGTFPVTYKSPAIDAALRTFEIWINVEGDDDYAVPGAQCSISVILRRSQGIGVVRDAVQLRDGKQWIFIPDNGVAKMVEVKTGLDAGGWVELLDAPVKAGDPVITQGQFLLNDGYPVRERTVGK